MTGRIAEPVLVAGAGGMVGSALVRTLARAGVSAVLAPGRAELDCADGAAVRRYLERHRPASVIVAAARVGGIRANATRPAEFLHENLAIADSLIHGAYAAGVAKLLFLGSTCIYPREASQPLKEEYLLTGPLEPTNEWYAVAKIAGVKLCQAYRRQYGCDFIAAMPTNLYGPGDSFDLEEAHVLPALIRRFEEARERGDAEVVLWGSGSPRREFLHVDDCAEACLHLMRCYSGEGPVNVGVGEDMTIAELAALVARLTGYGGAIRFDATQPDGTPRKLVDCTRIHALGWRARIGLEEGIAQTIAWFRAHRHQVRGVGVA